MTNSPHTSPRPIAWAVALGILLLLIGAFVAVTGVTVGLLVFNGCLGAASSIAETAAMAWIVGVWPLAVLATALVPPALLGMGRGGRAALRAFALGCLACALVWIAWLGIGYALFC